MITPAELERRIWFAAKRALESTKMRPGRRWYLDYAQPEAERHGTLAILTKPWCFDFPVFVPVMPGETGYADAPYDEALVLNA